MLIHTHVITINEKRGHYLKKNKERYVGRLGGRKVKKEMI